MAEPEDWNPPSQKMSDGAFIFHDWIPIRAAIEAAYAVLGRENPSGAVCTPDDWNLAGIVISAYLHQTRERCAHCRKALWQHETIRCLDCKAALCEHCAHEHFGR